MTKISQEKHCFILKKTFFFLDKIFGFIKNEIGNRRERIYSFRYIMCLHIFYAERINAFPTVGVHFKFNRRHYMKRKTLLASMLLLVTIIFSETIAIRPSNWDSNDAGTVINPFLINNLANLRWLSENAVDWWIDEFTPVHFLQTADIDAAESKNWNNGNGFRPIGRLGTVQGWSGYHINLFVGVYNGNNHKISNIYNAYDFRPYFSATGLFSYVQDSIIENLNVENIQIETTLEDEIGGVAGFLYRSIIQNCNTSGNINANRNRINAGGIVGEMSDAEIVNCSSSVNIIGIGQNVQIGGIVGYARNSSSISHNSCSGFLHGEGSFPTLGGIVGEVSRNINIEHNISHCTLSIERATSARAGGIVGYASRNISIVNNSSYSSINLQSIHVTSGGIVAYLSRDSKVENCYAIVAINSSSETGPNIGGIVGDASNSQGTGKTRILNSFAIGTINVDRFSPSLGGIASSISNNVNIDNCYSVVRFIRDSAYINGGGIAYRKSGNATISNSCWDEEITNINQVIVSGTNSRIFLTSGKTTSQMKTADTFTNLEWDFSEIWDIMQNVNTGYPYFRNMPEPEYNLTVELINPLNNSFNKDFDQILQWMPGLSTDPTGYKLFIGTSNPPNTMYDMGLTNFYKGLYEWGTQYYWQIVPYGANNDLDNYPVWSFTTMPNPAIVEFPYFQDFPTGWLPLGWRTFSYNSYIEIMSMQSEAYSPPNALTMNLYSSEGKATVITSYIENILTKRVKFYARGTTDRMLYVGTVSDVLDEDSFKVIQSIPLTSYYNQYVVSFDSAEGGYLAFRIGDNTSSYAVTIDDILIEINPNEADIVYNLPILNFGLIPYQEQNTASMTYTNIGNDNLIFYHFLPDDISTDISDPIIITPGESQEIVYTFHAVKIGKFTEPIWIETNTENNNYFSIPVNAHCISFDIGDIVEIGSENRTGCPQPWVPMLEYNYTQTIYLADEINRQDGEWITTIAFRINFDHNPYYHDTVKIYMGHTTRTTLSDYDWIDMNTMQQVFYGSFVIYKIPHEQETWLEIVLDEPFLYSAGQNLVIAAIKDSAVLLENQSTFYCSVSDTNRAVSGNVTTYPPFTVGHANRMIPNTKLRFSKHILNEEPGAILPTITRLHGNYPNPFNPETNITFSLEKAGEVSIDIYNIRGQKVNTVLRAFIEKGEHYVVWKGHDDTGKIVGSGIYFYKMQTDNFVYIKKMVLVK